MDYKSTWKFSRDRDYTLDDRTFAMPADCLAVPYRDISVPIGEGYTLSMKKICSSNGTYIDVIEKGEPEVELKMDLEQTIKCILGGFEELNCLCAGPFEIKEVIFNNPATIVYWKDGTKTVVTDTDNVTDGKAKPAESYSKETGLALCFMKKALGNKGNYNNAFRKWVKED